MNLIPLTNRHGQFYVNPARVQTIRAQQTGDGTEISYGEWCDNAEQFEVVKESVEVVVRLWNMAMAVHR